VSPPVFDQFVKNPEHFIAEASRIIAEQKATAIIEKLEYDEVEQKYETDIFTAAIRPDRTSRARPRS
jgi:type III restriction enzyme